VKKAGHNPPEKETFGRLHGPTGNACSDLSKMDCSDKQEGKGAET